ncbi:MAG: hypothetical protein AAF320_01835 [Myxococcota bacterium]
MKRVNQVFVLGMIFSLISCVSINQSVLSRQREAFPVPMEKVMVYFEGNEKIPKDGQHIAIFHASSAEGVSEAKMIDVARKKAGALGANFIVIDSMRDPTTGSKVANAMFGTSSNRKGRIQAFYSPSLDAPSQPMPRPAPSTEEHAH